MAYGVTPIDHVGASSKVVVRKGWLKAQQGPMFPSWTAPEIVTK